MKKRLYNRSRLWYIKWPDGSISIAVAKTVDDAVDLFERLGPAFPEVVFPIDKPEFLFDLTFNKNDLQWIPELVDDTKSDEFMDDIAPIIGDVINTIYDKNLIDSKTGRVRGKGKEMIKTSFKLHEDAISEQYKTAAAIHRTNCKDQYCLFCKDEKRNIGGPGGKAGLA